MAQQVRPWTLDLATVVGRTQLRDSGWGTARATMDTGPGRLQWVWSQPRDSGQGEQVQPWTLDPAHCGGDSHS